MSVNITRIILHAIVGTVMTYEQCQNTNDYGDDADGHGRHCDGPQGPEPVPVNLAREF
jgi:hypothetical protein